MWKQIFGQSPTPPQKDYASEAKQLAEAGEWEAAITLYSQAIDLNPHVAEYYTERGLLYSKLEQHEAAKADYDLAIQLDFQNAPAYLYRATWYKQNKDYYLALADLERAVKLFPNPAPTHKIRALVFLDLKMPHDALDALNVVCQSTIYNLDAHLLRGSIYLDLGDLDHAQIDFEYFLTKNPDDPKANYYLGRLFLQKGDPARALPYLDKAIEAQWVPQLTYIERSDAHHRLKNWEAAISDCLKVIEVTPKVFIPYARLQLIYLELEDDHKVILYGTQAIEAGIQDQPIIYYIRAQAHRNLSNWETTIADCNQAIELNSPDHDVYAYRALAYCALDKLEEALQDYNHVIENRPEIEPQWHVARGEVYLAMGNYEAAQADFDIAKDYLSEGRLMIDIALMKFALGQTEEALEIWKIFLAIDQKNFSDPDTLTYVLGLPKSLDKIARNLIAELPQNSE